MEASGLRETKENKICRLPSKGKHFVASYTYSTFAPTAIDNLASIAEGIVNDSVYTT